MTKLSLNAIESGLSKVESESAEIIKIDISLLVPSLFNNKEMNNIEETAVDIQKRGLAHNLVVWFGERNPETYEIENTGKYTIESGHRRLECIKYGNDKGLFDIQCVNCKVVATPINEYTERYNLIQDNREVRDESQESIYQDYMSLMEIIDECKKQGLPLPIDDESGRTRRKIAKKLNISEGQVGKLENVQKHAVDEVKQELKSGKITISTANEISKLSSDEQKEVLKGDKNKAFKTAKEQYKTIKNKQNNNQIETAQAVEVKENNIEEEAKENENIPNKDWRKEDYIDCLKYVLNDNNLEISENKKIEILNKFKGLLLLEVKTAKKVIEQMSN